MVNKKSTSSEEKQQIKSRKVFWKILASLIIIAITVIGVLMHYTGEIECGHEYCDIIFEEIAMGEDENGWTITQPTPRLDCFKEKRCHAYICTFEVFSWDIE